MTEADLEEAHKTLSLYKFLVCVEKNDPEGIRAKMFGIRQSVAALPESPEKMYLHFHYILGITNEACAERFDISRRSVYRLRRRALWLYARETKRKIKVDIK